ncbi:aldehyde dehydrogenase family protein [Niabella defluvii]|nr:aldehyde dehydrogenase family protein [Niabella sp. I65]
MNEALYKDLKKSKEEVWITETGLVLSEISYFLKNLDELAEPKRTGTNLLNLPGKSYIMYEPLGVVLIIAPWNYPFQLSLIPLIGALAAGNCAVLKPSEVAMATEAVIQKIVAETFAPQYVSFASGNGADVVPGMIKSFRFDHIFYTGVLQWARPFTNWRRNSWCRQHWSSGQKSLHCFGKSQPQTGG